MTANNTLEKKQGEEHVKRPPNKFLCYRSETLENEFKGVKVQMKLFSRTIGQRWNAMSKEAQAPYAKRAEQLRKEHAEKYPDYKYNPKRGQKTKQRAADEQLTGGVQAPRKQGRRRVRFPSGTSQDVSNSHKVAAVRTAARSRRAAKASNTKAASQNQNDISYKHAIQLQPSSTHQAETDPAAPLRAIKLPTVSNFMRAATAHRAPESPVLPLSPQGFQDPPLLTRRPPLSATQFVSTSCMRSGLQPEHCLQLERVPVDLGVPVPSVADYIPPMMGPPWYEIQGGINDKDPVYQVSWPLWPEAPLQPATQPSYSWPVDSDKDWSFPVLGTSEDSWLPMNTTEVVPSGSYVASAEEIEQWERAFAGYPYEQPGGTNIHDHNCSFDTEFIY